MIINRLIFLCFFVSSALIAMDNFKELELSNDYLKSISRLIDINNNEITENKNREYWWDKVHKGLTGSVLIVPYAVLYYGSSFYPGYTDTIKYCFPPFSLLTYYLTFNENYKKTSLHSNAISQDLEPLCHLLPNMGRVIEYALFDEKQSDLSLKNSSLILHLQRLEAENKHVNNFFFEILLVGAKKHQNNPDMMALVIGGSPELRLIIIISFLKLLERADNKFLFFTDSKPSVNIAAFDWWKVSTHSYSSLVNKSADELNNNLILLKESPQKLREMSNKSIIKTIMNLLAFLVETKKNN